MERRCALIVCIALCVFGNIYGAANPVAAAKDKMTPKAGKKAEKKDQQKTQYEKQLEVIAKEKERYKKELETYTKKLDELESRLNALSAQRDGGNGKQTTYVTRMYEQIRKSQQVVAEIIQVVRRILDTLQEHEKAVEKVRADPNFESLKYPAKAAPTFEDLQTVSDRLFTYRSQLKELSEARKTTTSDAEQRRKTLDAISKELQDKKASRESFAQSQEEQATTVGELTRNQQGDLLDAEVAHLEYQKRLAELKIAEDERRLALIETQESIVEHQVRLLEKSYKEIKQAVNIDAEYIRNEKNEVEKQRQEFAQERQKLEENINALRPRIENVKSAVQRAQRKYDLSDARLGEVENWQLSPDQLTTPQAWLGKGRVASYIAQRQLYETKVEYWRAQIEQKRISSEIAEKRVEIIRSWRAMIQNRFKSDEEIEQATTKYKTDRSQLKADLTEVNDKRDRVTHQLYQLTTARDAVKDALKALEKKQDIFERPQNYEQVRDFFQSADDAIKQQIASKSRLLEVYAKTIAKLRQGVKQLDDVIDELSAKSFWKRSEQSIEWKDVKSFMPDLERFFLDIRSTGLSYAKKMTVKHVFAFVKNLVASPIWIVLLIVRMLIVLLVYFVLHLYLPDIYRYFLHMGRLRLWGAAQLVAFVATIVGFLQRHLLLVYSWLVALFVMRSEVLPEYFLVLFYLASIVYLLAVAHKFFDYLIEENKERGYLIISESYQTRFMRIVPTLAYATVVIQFFRQAFITYGYYTSQVPEILMAANVILAQAALIGLLSKEWLVNKLHRVQTPLTRTLAAYADRYYYLILACVVVIVVMSNPYVGYGRQVWYVLYRLGLTVLVLPIFSWLHNWIKQSLSDVCFYYAEGSSVQERFRSGKTWYGLLIVASFITFIGLGFVVGARIWGYDVGFSDIFAWLNTSFYQPGIDEVTGKPIEISVMSLLKVALYVVGGAFLAYVVNRFLLRRIFDPLLIGSGIQSTIMTFSRYFLIIMAFLIGLQSAGLDQMATQIAVVLGVIGFAIKEPIGDFFSYFLILVQRPVKVGDLVKIGDDVFGVIRQVTPRSTIVRHKNSVTLVIPNSRITNSTVYNWHYSKSFGAFDDILVTVPFEADPAEVRDIFHEVLDKNPNILKNPSPVIWLLRFSADGYVFSVRGYLSNEKLHEQFDVASQIRIDIVHALREAGFALAYPTRIMHFKSGKPAVFTRSMSAETQNTDEVAESAYEHTSDEKDAEV